MQADIFLKKSEIERDSKLPLDQFNETENSEVAIRLGDQQDEVQGERRACQFSSLDIVDTRPVTCGLHAPIPNGAVMVVGPLSRVLLYR